MAALGSFLGEAVDDGATLLLTGEPGVGKPALLVAAAEMAAAEDVRVIRRGGVEYESDGNASAARVEGATLKVYPGAPHGITDTHKGQLNADLLAFVRNVGAEQ